MSESAEKEQDIPGPSEKDIRISEEVSTVRLVGPLVCSLKSSSLKSWCLVWYRE